MVGGNGQNVTWRLAAKYADELNVDGMSREVRAAMPIIRQRCEEIGSRSGLTASLGSHLVGDARRATGAQRADMVAGYRELGISRLIGHNSRLRGEQRCAGGVGSGLPRGSVPIWPILWKSVLKNSGVPLFVDEPSRSGTRVRCVGLARAFLSSAGHGPGPPAQ